jgi:hypothetical protein
MKELVSQAVEQEVNTIPAPPSRRARVKLPLIRKWKGPKLDLSNFDFAELLG